MRAFFLIFFGYWGLGYLGLQLAIPPGYATAIWPASGLALVAMLLTSRAAAPAIGLASLLINLHGALDPNSATPLATTAIVALGIACASALQAALGASLVRRAVGSLAALDNARSIGLFLVLGGPLSCLLSATLSVTLLNQFGLLHPVDAYTSWLTWWIGDSMGVLVFAPILLCGFAEPASLWKPRRLTVALPLLAVLLVITTLYCLLRINVATTAERAQHVRTETHAHALQSLLDGFLLQTKALTALYHSSQSVDAEEFREFTTSMHETQQTPDLQYYWITPSQSGYASTFSSVSAQGATAQLTNGAALAGALRDMHQVAHNTGGIQAWHGALNDAAAPYLWIAQPIYDKQTPHDTVADRRAHLQGFATIAAPFPPAHLPYTSVLATTSPDPAQPTATVANLTFTATAPAQAHPPVNWSLWLVLTAGLSFSALLGFFLLLITGRTAKIQEIVDQQTAALRTANADLEQLLHSQRTTEAEKVALEFQMAQAQKMEVIGKMTSGISHDFNNLLGGILGYVSLLRKDIGENTKALARVDTIGKLIERGKHLTSQLLDFSRQRFGQKKSAIDINQAVRDNQEFLVMSLPKNVRVDTKLADQLPQVNAHFDQLMHMLLNFSINARDAMPNGGVITFTTSDVLADRAYCAPRTGLTPGYYVCVSIEDTGTGIPSDVLQKIFQPFFTTKGSGKGTGLGLSMAVKTMQEHQGILHVTSTVGVGTAFHLYFPALAASGTPAVAAVASPATPAAAPAAVPAASVTPGAPLSGIRILVVDDEPAIRDMTIDVLTDAGAIVTSDVDGRNGAQRYQSEWQSIDVIVSDLIMPHLTGAEMVTLCRKIREDIPVVFITGYFDDPSLAVLLQTPRTTLVNKPFLPDQLLAAIARVRQ